MTVVRISRVHGHAPAASLREDCRYLQVAKVVHRQACACGLKFNLEQGFFRVQKALTMTSSPEDFRLGNVVSGITRV
jgi:hypothetical protein